MKSAILTILAFALSSLLAAQTDESARLFQKDALQYAEAQRFFNRLPVNLLRYADVFDGMKSRVCAEGQSDNCLSMREGAGLISEQLRQINRRLDTARYYQQQLKASFERLQASYSPGQSRMVYHKNRSEFSSAEKKFRKARLALEQQQRQALRKLGRYYVKDLKKETPSVIPIMMDFLKISMLEKEDSIKLLESQISKIQQRRDSLSTNLNVFEFKIEQSNQLLTNQQFALTRTENELLQAHQKLSELEATKRNLQEEKNNDERLSKRLSMEIDSLNLDLNTKSLALSEVLNQLHNESAQMKRNESERIKVNQELMMARDTLKWIRDENELNLDRLNEKRKWNYSLIAMTVCSSILAAFFYARESRRAKRGKAKVEAANATLSEKGQQLEALIRELHHRTKNNLQEISSILFLQMNEVEDLKTKEALEDARARIDALGMIHRLLYQPHARSFTAISISEYIYDLTQHLLRANDTGGRAVKTAFNIEKLHIEMDVAVHIGLAINELLQNCFKHAFAGSTAPMLGVDLCTRGNDILLTVRDNGPGFTSQVLHQATGEASVGLKLVRIITEGRGGQFDYYNDNGAVSHIRLPFEEGDVSNAVTEH
ncbi:MAG: hypothetical protein IT269_01820 [Saprospiraceae bacterium]|nr:hypothetical protein [Saprospiraceae bacterium]